MKGERLVNDGLLSCAVNFSLSELYYFWCFLTLLMWEVDGVTTGMVR